jgi:hypothetical protein
MQSSLAETEQEEELFVERDGALVEPEAYASSWAQLSVDERRAQRQLLRDLRRDYRHEVAREAALRAAAAPVRRAPRFRARRRRAAARLAKAGPSGDPDPGPQVTLVYSDEDDPTALERVGRLLGRLLSGGPR